MNKRGIWKNDSTELRSVRAKASWAKRSEKAKANSSISHMYVNKTPEELEDIILRRAATRKANKATNEKISASVKAGWDNLSLAKKVKRVRAALTVGPKKL